MAEVTGLRNNALPYPVYGAPFGLVLPIRYSYGALVTGASGLDSEVSKNGDTFADCTNEATEIGSTGYYYLLLTAAEIAADVVAIQVKTSTTDATTSTITLYPRKLVTIRSGTAASAGSVTSTIILDSGASAEDDFYNGMLVVATIDSNVEARVISDYTGSSKTATVVPDWNVAPDSDDTFVIKLPEGWQVHQSNQTMLGGSSQSATDLKDFADTGYDPSTHKVQGVVLVDTTTTNSDMRGTDSAATAAELAKVPKSDGTTTWNATAQGTIQSMANAGITAYDPPTRAEATSDKDSILSKMLKYFQLALRKDAATAVDNATELTAINASGGSGGGAYINQTDSQEAMRDNTGTAGAGLTDLGGMSTTMKGQVNAESDTALSDAGVTSARMGYVENLNVGGNVASSAEVTSVQNNTRVVRVVPTVIERPDSGTQAYRIELLAYDDVGNMEAPDSAPTVALVDQGGTDLSSRLDSATGSLVSTGRYRWVYTATSTDDLEQLVWTFSVVEGGNTRLYGNTSVIVDTTAVDFTSADRTKLEAIHTKLPSKSYLTGTGNSDGDLDASEATGNFPGSVGSVAGDVAGKVLGGGSGTITGTGARVVDASGNNVAAASAASAIQTVTDRLDDTLEDNAGTYRFTEPALVNAPSGGGGGATAGEIADAVWDEATADHVAAGSFGAGVNNLLTRITSTLFNGITSLRAWLGALAGKTADTSTRAEINATVAGAGYLETTDSLQAIRDAGLVGGTTLVVNPISVTVSSGQVAETSIESYTATEPSFTFTIIDESELPVDLSTADLEFVVYDRTSRAVVFSVDDTITVGGDDDNVVTVPLTTAETAAANAGTHRYVLRNTTSGLVVARGEFKLVFEAVS